MQNVCIRAPLPTDDEKYVAWAEAGRGAEGKGGELKKWIKSASTIINNRMLGRWSRCTVVRCVHLDRIANARFIM